MLKWLLVLAVLVAAGYFPAAGDPPPTQEVAPAGPPTPVLAWSLAGTSTWYGSTSHYGAPTVAWYTRQSRWGAPVIFYAAAGPKLREAIGDQNPYHEHYPVLVRNPKTGKTIIAVIVDWCQCSKGKPREKLIDLSPAAFEALGVPLTRGIQKVIVSQFAADQPEVLYTTPDGDFPWY